MFRTDFIARKELLACLLAVFCFRRNILGRIATIFSDNQNVVSWLTKGRSKNVVGCKFLAVWELGKYKARCKISPIWLPSSHNRTADALSRNKIPGWLARSGSRVFPDVQKIAHFVDHPTLAWSSVFN